MGLCIPKSLQEFCRESLSEDILIADASHDLLENDINGHIYLPNVENWTHVENWMLFFVETLYYYSQKVCFFSKLLCWKPVISTGSSQYSLFSSWNAICNMHPNILNTDYWLLNTCSYAALCYNPVFGASCETASESSTFPLGKGSDSDSICKLLIYRREILPGKT